ncbi:MAG: hypothetical protein M3Z35_00835 [Nitrospirota bacterium]|nr:hypothetical protein [Nitrospirota bacterium]
MRSFGAGIKLAVVVGIIMTLIVASPESVLANETSGSSGEEGTGIKVASWAATVPYCLAKSTFAALGGIVGVFAYVFSGGNAQTAQAVWTTSILGTYIIRPEHLRGGEPVHFLGQGDDYQDAPSPSGMSPPKQDPGAPLPSEHLKK